MAALQYVDVPHYNAILFRRTYADLTLPGALLDRARDWLDTTDARWNDREHTWQFPRGDVRCSLHGDACPSEYAGSLTFGYLQTERTKFRYQSADFQFIGFDELTQFSRSMYLFLFSRLRKDTAMVNVPLRMRSASNPGGIGHDWVKQRFLTERDEHRVFIPSKLTDNPSIDYETYLRSLEQLDPVTRARMLNGDWDVRDEGMFKRFWWQMLEARPVLPRARLVRYWDLAATEEHDGNDPDYTVGTLIARDEDKRLYVLDVRRERISSAGVEALVRATAQQDGRHVAVRIEQEPGAAGKSLISYYTRHVLAGYDVRGVPSSRDKVTRAAPLASQAEVGNVFVVRAPWLSDWLDEFDGFPFTQHDDQVDSASGALEQLLATGTVQSSSYIPPIGDAPVVRRGDLVLRGAKYMDKT